MLLHLDELPADVATIAGKVAEFIGVDVDELFIGDADHEELSAGAYSIAYEGWDWAYEFSNAISDRTVTVPDDWWVSSAESWKVHLYPEA